MSSVSKNTAFVLAIALLVSSRLEAGVPAAWARYVELNQTRNTRVDIGTLPSGAVVPIVYFNVPEKDLTVARSRNLTEEETAIFEDTHEGRRTIRVFLEAGPDNAELIRKLTRRYGDPIRAREGTRLQSIKTFLTWDPEHPERTPLALKFPKKVFIGDDRLATERNGKADSLSAVPINDVVESALGNTARGGFLPERYAVAFKDPAIPYAFSARSMAPLPSSELLPVHGFLGSSSLEIERGRPALPAAVLEAAKKAAISPEKWLVDEYGRKLGRFLAEMNFAHGIYPEAHTQNLLLDYEAKSGRIRRFVFQDVADIQLDPFGRVMQGKPALTAAHFRAGESILFDGSPTAIAEGVRPGTYNGAYTSQSALLSNLPEPLQRKIAGAMLDAYASEARKITGLPLKANAETRAIVSRFKAGELARTSLDRRETTREEVAANQVETVFNATFGQVAQGLFDRAVPETPRSDAVTQERLRRDFAARMERGQIAYGAANAPALVERALRGEAPSVEFQMTDRGIAAFVRQGKARRALAIAFHADKPERVESCLASRLKSLR